MNIYIFISIFLNDSEQPILTTIIVTEISQNRRKLAKYGRNNLIWCKFWLQIQQIPFVPFLPASQIPRMHKHPNTCHRLNFHRKDILKKMLLAMF